MKKLLVACEEIQRVCIEFRKRGWETYSCDIVSNGWGTQNGTLNKMLFHY